MWILIVGSSLIILSLIYWIEKEAIYSFSLFNNK
jgi:hypothetical protein